MSQNNGHTPPDLNTLGLPMGRRELVKLIDKAYLAGAVTSDYVVIQSQCHPSAGVIAIYWASANSLVFECRECMAAVCQIKVGM